MSPSKILSLLCVSFILGIAVESYLKIPHIFLWVFLSAAVTALIVAMFVRSSTTVIVVCCFLFLLIGIGRLQITEFFIANNALSKFNEKAKMTITGVITDAPDVRDTEQKLKVNVQGSTVLITTSKYPSYSYLDKIKITGKLETPPIFNDFNYRDYLLKDGIYSVENYPSIEVLAKNQDTNIFSFTYAKILFLKGNINAAIENNFSNPQKLLLEGVLLGDNSTMTDKLRNELNSTGLRFLTAISGVHIIIISAILMTLLLSLGFWRSQAFYISIVFIWLYIILTGCSASGIRAGIMGSIFLIAQFLGRQNTSSRTIILAAAFMLLQNPLLLLYDVGFQLSFLASMGIIYLKPPLQALVQKMLKNRLVNLSDIIVTTLTAQIFTLPIMIYNFGTVSLISPITNILILPVLPWILVFGFLFAALTAVSQFLGYIFLAPCWFLISYFSKVMDIFSQPWASQTVNNVSWYWPLALYIIIIGFTFWINKKFSKINVY